MLNGAIPLTVFYTSKIQWTGYRLQLVLMCWGSEGR